MGFGWVVVVTAALVSCSQNPEESSAGHLHDALKNRHHAALADLISAGSDVNARDAEGLAPLHIAATLGDRHATLLLLDHGADPQARAPYLISDDAGHELEAEGYTALHFAAAAGSAEVCKALLSSGAELDASTPNGKTPLHAATAEGRLNVVRLFLRQGTMVNASFVALRAERKTYPWKERQTGTSLHVAARFGYKTIATELLANGADPNAKDEYLYTPLHVSARYGRRAIAEILLANGADLLDRESGHMVIHLAAEGGFSTIISLFLTHFDGLSQDLDLRVRYVNLADGLFGYTPLHYAAKGGHLSAATLLIRKGADVNATSEEAGMFKMFEGEEYKGPTADRPLHEAAAGDKSGRVVTLLLDHGAEVNAKAREGRLPLHDATMHANIEAFRILLARGAQIDAKWKGITPLGVIGGQSWQDSDATREIIATLLARGADVDGTGFQGNTQLHRAAAGRSRRIVALLLEHRANPNVANEDGATALSLVLSRWEDTGGKLRCVRELLAHGADPDLANALHRSVWCGHDYVRLLVENGADVNLRWNGTDSSALHLAVERGDYGEVKYLLEQGASVDVRDKDGKTPADVAEQQLKLDDDRYREIVTLLQSVSEDR